MAVTCHVGVGNWAQVLYKSSQGSLPLSQLPSSRIKIFLIFKRSSNIPLPSTQRRHRLQFSIPSCPPVWQLTNSFPDKRDPVSKETMMTHEKWYKRLIPGLHISMHTCASILTFTCTLAHLWTHTDTHMCIYAQEEKEIQLMWHLSSGDPMKHLRETLHPQILVLGSDCKWHSLGHQNHDWWCYGQVLESPGNPFSGTG